MKNIELIFTEILSENLKKEVKILSLKSLSGGCINNALRAQTSIGNFFIKYNSDKNLGIYETEVKGLKKLAEANVLDIPHVIAIGATEEIIYLILEYIESSSPVGSYWEDFGISLARLHNTSNDYYGLDHNNYIGSLPQINHPNKSWLTFFIECRLQIQLKMARDNNRIEKNMVLMMEALYKKIPELLSEDKPSLLHGDLWSGNVMVNSEGKAILIDPAIYFGHREAELAFTTLFGRFDEGFYNGYNSVLPLLQGFQGRFDIYNLYPLLVHVNLFGGGYINAVKSILKNYL